MSHLPKVFVAGHKGLLGSAIVRHINETSNNSVLTAGREELDLLDSVAVLKFFEKHNLDEIYLPAAKLVVFRLIILFRQNLYTKT